MTVRQLTEHFGNESINTGKSIGDYIQMPLGFAMTSLRISYFEIEV